MTLTGEIARDALEQVDALLPEVLLDLYEPPDDLDDPVEAPEVVRRIWRAQSAVRDALTRLYAVGQ